MILALVAVGAPGAYLWNSCALARPWGLCGVTTSSVSCALSRSWHPDSVVFWESRNPEKQDQEHPTNTLLRAFLVAHNATDRFIEIFLNVSFQSWVNWVLNLQILNSSEHIWTCLNIFEPCRCSSLHDGTIDQWCQWSHMEPRIGDAFVVRRQLEELKRAESAQKNKKKIRAETV